MWLFGRKVSLKDSNIFRDFTDWHCHLLPGVDDGVPTMEESLQLLALYEKLGIREVWLTPHIMEDIPNTTEELKARFEELQAAYHGKVRLHLSAEYMLDNLFEKRLKDNDLLPLGSGGDRLLVETSYFNPPMDLYHTLERIKAAGYYPVLAHPERYIYMEESDYRRLKKHHVKFQLNLFSLAGAYGKSAKEKAGWLIKNKFYDLAGTDTHRLAGLEKVISEKKMPFLF